MFEKEGEYFIELEDGNESQLNFILPSWRFKIDKK